MRRFGLPPQPTSDDQALTRATVDTRFNVTKDRAELTDVTLALDDSKITGNFTLEGFDDPAYRFALVLVEGFEGRQGLLAEMDLDSFVAATAGMDDLEAVEASVDTLDLGAYAVLRLVV
jgi:hypothetical protein